MLLRMCPSLRTAKQTGHRLGARLPANFALAALCLATIAMVTLHLLQRRLDPFEEPVSFYIHGDYGWLLTIALYCFGVSAVVVAVALRSEKHERLASLSLTIFGVGMLLAGAAPSDRWFPWEAPATPSGLVHAAAAVFSPPVLLVSMVAYARRSSGRQRRFSVFLAVVYTTGLVASALALGIGLARAAPPPLIGLAERVLALTGVIWLAIMAKSRR
jgi:hypothetical protein